MLIRLIPTAPHPSILFSLSFSNIYPSPIPSLSPSPSTSTQNLIPPTLPPAWDRQLQLLAHDQLELPPFIHALDKSVGVVSLVEEVVFDLNGAQGMVGVSVVWVDGGRDEWVLSKGDGGTNGRSCLERLEAVVNDVLESAEDKERSVVEGECGGDTKESIPLPIPLATPVTNSKASSRHKKQRSLLMSLVASLVPSSSSTPLPPPPARVPTPPPQQNPPALPLPPTNPPLTPQALRRRARSELVDTFRLFVLGELRRRCGAGDGIFWSAGDVVSPSPSSFPPPDLALSPTPPTSFPTPLPSSTPIGTGKNYDYSMWITRSMLRRAEEHLVGMIRDARCLEGLEGEGEGEKGVDAVPSLSFDGEGEGDGSDGSSLETPSESTSINTPSLSSSLSSSPTSSSSSPTTPPTHYLPPTYTPLLTLASRLSALLSVIEMGRVREDEGEKERESIMEGRGRRRAWLGGFGGVGCGSSGGGNGFAVPFVKSRLSVWWGPDDLVEDDDDLGDCEGEGGEVDGGSGRELFPVSEEDESCEDVCGVAVDGVCEDEDEMMLIREMEMGLGFGSGYEFGYAREIGMGMGMDHPYTDLEGGGGLEVEVDVEKPTNVMVVGGGRRPNRPRVRTQSMSLPLTSSSSPSSPLASSPYFTQQQQPLLATTIQKPGLALRKPEHHHHHRQQQQKHLQVGMEMDVPGVEVDAEFTLAMDLPFSVRVGDVGIGMGGVKMDMDMEGDGGEEEEGRGRGRGRRRKFEYECERSWLAPQRGGVGLGAGYRR